MPIPGQTSATLAPASRATAQTTAVFVGRDGFEPVAGLLAIVFPGLGHWFLGERGRASIIAAGILSLFFGGLLIGGIDAVDSQENTIWFAGQALVGPLALGVDYYHQHRLKVYDNSQHKLRTANPDETRDASGRAVQAAPGQLPPNSKSLGRMNELGTLFCTVAGMLNLIVIIDAFLHTKRPRQVGLRTTLADAESPLSRPQSIDRSLKGGTR